MKTVFASALVSTMLLASCAPGHRPPRPPRPPKPPRPPHASLTKPEAPLPTAKALPFTTMVRPEGC